MEHVFMVDPDDVVANERDVARFPHAELAIAVVIEFLAGDITVDELDADLSRYAGLA